MSSDADPVPSPPPSTPAALGVPPPKGEESAENWHNGANMFPVPPVGEDIDFSGSVRQVVNMHDPWSETNPYAPPGAKKRRIRRLLNRLRLKKD